MFHFFAVAFFLTLKTEFLGMLPMDGRLGRTSAAQHSPGTVMRQHPSRSRSQWVKVNLVLSKSIPSWSSKTREKSPIIPDTSSKCSVQLFRALEVFVAWIWDRENIFLIFLQGIWVVNCKSNIHPNWKDLRSHRQAADLILKVNGEAVTGGGLWPVT